MRVASFLGASVEAEYWGFFAARVGSGAQPAGGHQAPQRVNLTYYYETRYLPHEE